MIRVSDVNRLLQRHGRTLTLSIKSGQSYDPRLGKSVNTSSDYEIRGYIYNSKAGLIDGSEIQIGRRRVILQATDVNFNAYPKPSVGDVISGVNDGVKIEYVTTVYDEDVALFYNCYAVE